MADALADADALAVGRAEADAEAEADGFESLPPVVTSEAEDPGPVDDGELQATATEVTRIAAEMLRIVVFIASDS